MDMANPEISPFQKACTFAELSATLEQINEHWKNRWNLGCPGFCFRGADIASYNLNPSLLRWPHPEKIDDLAGQENSLYVEFRLRSKPLVGHLVTSAWEAMLTMQQYGFPTRLLDWSKSLAVATYFAVRDIDCDKDGAVWIMASRRLMELRGQNNAWRTVIGDPSVETLAMKDSPNEIENPDDQVPAPIAPDQFASRMIVQQGIYTLHSYRRFALERLAAADRLEFGDAAFLHKITIPACAKEGLRSELLLLAGITEDVLFPDLDGLARGIVAEFKRVRRRDDLKKPTGAISSFFSDTAKP